MKKKLLEAGFVLETYRGENHNYSIILEHDIRTKTCLIVNIIGDTFSGCFLESDNIKFGTHNEISLSGVETEEQFWILFKILKIKDN